MAIALTLLTLSPLTSYFTLPAADGHGFLSADKQYSGSYINLNTTNFTNYMTVPLKIGHDTTMVKPFVTNLNYTLTKLSTVLEFNYKDPMAMLAAQFRAYQLGRSSQGC